ncbi:MAG: DUF1786 family protein [Dehalococcoidia bacterium]|nr:DUF1786 family protein [Dehalococcoidia bacterium]
MRILAIDVGTGTQDILLFDSATTVENCVKMVMPSPTRIVASAIEAATRAGDDILLAGATMGGGPSSGAARSHLKAGLKVYATPAAACTFNDDLAEVARSGVTLVSEDEARLLQQKARRVRHIETRDLDQAAVGRALSAFGVDPHYDGVAVAVQDHGAAPAGISDRVFRFDYIRRVVESDNRLAAFAYMAADVPSFLSRMKAVAETMDGSVPSLVMDTGPAACLGTLEDRRVSEHENKLLINVGNMHTLATHLCGNRIVGVFEHHTGHLSMNALEGYISRLLAGTITYEEVYEDHGHGAYLAPASERACLKGAPFIAATGPHRVKLSRSSLTTYLAVPHGDMMLAGCFGLVRAFGERQVNWREEIETALGS